jgi:DNA polymerase IV
MRVIFHIDMDAFYASIEQRDNPELRGKPVIVGGAPNQRGVVCAASYEARAFGIRSALPSVIAARLCPSGIFLRPRMDHYREESAKIFEILRQTGAVIEPMSIDEAYLQWQPAAADHDPDEPLLQSVPLARELKTRIQQERCITATIGIAANKFLAKIASDFNKPDGLTLIPERDKIPFLRPLPIRTIHGVGKVTEEVLHRAGLKTVGDLQDYPGDLRALAGSFGPTLKRFAFGVDDRPVETSDEIKSISSEETFERDTQDRAQLRACLRAQADEIATKLKNHHLGACTVQVKIRYANFQTLTRQISAEEPITDPGGIYRLACFLLGREKLVSKPLRLLGLGVSNFKTPEQRQLLLFG